MSNPTAINRRTLHYYTKAALHHKWIFVINIIAPIVGVLFGDIISRFYLAQLFEQLANFQNIPKGEIWQTFYLLIAFMIIQMTSWRINDYTYLWRQGRDLRRMEQSMLDKMQSHSFRFYADNFAGSLVTQFNRFLKSYEMLSDIFMFEILTSAAMLIFSIGFLLFMAPPLGIALLIWSVLFIGTMAWLTIKKDPVTRTAAAADSKVTAHVADVISNIMTVKVFARRGLESKQFAKTSNDRFTKRRKSWDYDLKIRNIRWAFVGIFYLVYLSLSIHLVTSGQVSIAIVLTAQFYIMSIYDRLFNIARTIEKAAIGFADASEMTAVLDLEPEIKDPSNPEKLAIKDGAIDLKSVTFKYQDADRAVFDSFNLSIKAGQKIGLVGHSGSGKSTLTRLLLRFSDIDNGTIEIDGQNISKILQDDLRSRIAYVPQEPILFHRSLMDNIRYGRNDASDEEVYEAARLANAAGFIEKMPLKYETLVGERGVKLSGGEKQRVAIARAMLSRAPILLLDEATSALDSKSEKLITDSLDRLMKNRTTLVVAHRLSTIRKLDRILVMKDGQIIEDGKHETLLAKKGEYAELWAHQSGGFLEE